MILERHRPRWNGDAAQVAGSQGERSGAPAAIAPGMRPTAVVSHVRCLVDDARWLPPLLMRAILGVTFVLTGWGKLHDLARVEAYFASLHIPAPTFHAPAIATLEFVGGILLLAGLGTRVVSVLLSGTMAVAIYAAIWPDADGITAVLGGIEAIYLAAFVQLAFGGAGAVSLDRLVTRIKPALSVAAPAAAA
jgi:putative oxidoreductase